MTYYYNIYEEANLVIVIPYGNYSLVKIMDLIQSIVENPLYHSTYDILVDIRNIEYTPIIDEIFAISDFIISIKENFKGKTALISDKYVLFKLFKLSTLFVSKKGVHSKIFKEVDDALLWLSKTESTLVKTDYNLNL